MKPRAPLLGAQKTEEAFEQVEWGAWSQAGLTGSQQCTLAQMLTRDDEPCLVRRLEASDLPIICL